MGTHPSGYRSPRSKNESMMRHSPRARLRLVPLEDRCTPTVLTPGLVRQAYDLNFRFAAPGGQVVAADGRGQTAEDALYTTPAGHTGITFVAATGDDYGPGGYAAYSPNVLAVGGTRLTTDSAGNWVSEQPWHSIIRGQVVGTAGGFSQYEPE